MNPTILLDEKFAAFAGLVATQRNLNKTNDIITEKTIRITAGAQVAYCLICRKNPFDHFLFGQFNDDGLPENCMLIVSATSKQLRIPTYLKDSLKIVYCHAVNENQFEFLGFTENRIAKRYANNKTLLPSIILQPIEHLFEKDCT